MRAVLGLGANVGDCLRTFRQAMRALTGVPCLRVERTSRVYRTAPVGGPAEQPAYLNAAALVTFEGEPETLLEALLDIEKGLGRVRRERWGPRVIDLDVLWIEGMAVRSERLVVPHPRLRERAFALVPMLEVAPGAKDPSTEEPYVVPPGEVEETGDSL